MTGIDTSTALYGVFGDPVAHSLSPVMHNSAFRHLGENGVYLAFRVTDIPSAVVAIRALNLSGISVTIPHKVSILPLLDDVTPLARKIGAVNTVINRDGKLTGDNTDCRGAVRALLDATPVSRKRVAVLGAGGAARAIGYGLMEEGAAVTLVNRTIPRGEELAGEMRADFCPLEDFSGGHDILVNTTSAGMTPYTDAMPVSSGLLDPDMVVMDIVYNPLETRLLAEARRRGCITVDGVAMFVYQGAIQFEMWTGRQAPLDVMRTAVLKALEQK